MTKKSQLSIQKIIILIIAIVVLAFIFSFIFKANLLKYLKNLPSYPSGGDREVDLSSLSDEEIKSVCPYIVGQIKYGRGEQYIYFFNGDNTHLYWDEKNKKIVHDEAEDVGEIINGKILFNPLFMSQYYLKYNYKLDDLNLLENSYKITGNLLCKTEEEREQNEGEKYCSAEALKLDFPMGDKLSEEGMELTKFFLASNFGNKIKSENILDKNSVDISGEGSFELTFDIKTSLAFCYLLKSDVGEISLGYVGEGGSLEKKIFYWNPSREKEITLTAWNSEENKLVFKKIRVNLQSFLKDYDDGTIISDPDFKEIASATDGAIFYILDSGYAWDISGLFEDRISLAANIYKIIKSSDKLEIFARYKNSDGGWEWHRLDCDQSYFTPGTTALRINKIEKTSLKENLAQFCEWN